MGKNDKNGKKRGWNKKFREKNNINIKYKMSKKGGLMQLVAYGYIPYTQSFKGDVTIQSANEIGDGIAMLTLEKLIGEVKVVLLDLASNNFETKEYQGLDVAGLAIGLATGSKAVLKVETSGDVWSMYEVLGVKEENGKGKVKMAVKPIGDGDVISQKKVLRKAKMELLHIPYWTLNDQILHWADPSRDALLAEYQWDFSRLREATYDSKKKTLIFANDRSWRCRNGDCFYSSLMFYSAAASGAGPLAFRFGSSGEGMIELVANVEWVKVDGKELKVKLSNKGLNGEGKTAKKAIAGIDKLKSGRYSMRIRPLADASDMLHAFAGDWFTQAWASDRQSASRYGSLLILDVKGVLKKTKKMGLFELEFKTKEGDRLLYKDDKDTVKSKPVKSYLEGLAGKYDKPFPDDSCENRWWEPAPRIVRMKTASGKEVIGQLTELKWDTNMKVWMAKVGVELADVERLQKKSKIIEVGFGYW
jgi:hypothetical protein